MRFSVAVPRCKKSLASSMLRKYRRLRRPGGLRREYKKLRSLLPGATRSHHLRKKVGVVEAAYQYICELQAALLDKFSTKGIPEDLAGVVRGKIATASDIQALALHLINNSTANNNNNFPRTNYVNSTTRSTLPLFIAPSASQLNANSGLQLDFNPATLISTNSTSQLSTDPPTSLDGNTATQTYASTTSQLDATLASINRPALPNTPLPSVTDESCREPSVATPATHLHSNTSHNTHTQVPAVSTSQSNTEMPSLLKPNPDISSTVQPTTNISPDSSLLSSSSSSTSSASSMSSIEELQ